MSFATGLGRTVSKRELGAGQESSVTKRFVADSKLPSANISRQSLCPATDGASRVSKSSLPRMSMGGASLGKENVGKENVKPRLISTTTKIEEVVKPEPVLEAGLFIKTEGSEETEQESEVRTMAVVTFDEAFVNGLCGLLEPKKSIKKTLNVAKENETLLASLRAVLTQSRDKQVSFIQGCMEIEQRLKSGAADLEKAKEELSNSKDQVSSELQTAASQLAELEKNFISLKQEKEVVLNEKNDMTNVIELLNVKNKDQTQMIQNLTRDIELKTKEYEASMNLLQQAKKDIEMKIEEINKLVITHHNNDIRSQANFDELSRKLQESNIQCKLLQDAKTQLEQGGIEARMKLMEMEQKLNNERNVASMTQQAVERANKEVERLNTQASNQSDEFKRMMDGFHRTQQFHEDRITQASNEKKELDTKIWALQAKKEELDSMLRTTTSQLETVTKKGEEEKSYLETTLAEQIKNYNKISNEFTLCREDFTRTSQALAEQNSEIQKNLTNEKQQLEARNTEINKELTNKETQLITMTNKYEEVNKQLEMFKKHAGVDSLEQLDRLCKVSVEAEYLRQQLTGKENLAFKLCETETNLKQTKDLLFHAEIARRHLHNQIQEMKGNVRVYVRVRPTETGEEQGIEVNNTQDTHTLSLMNSEEGKEHSFQFDHVFSEKANQADIFVEVSPLVQSSLDGYNVCLFSYGQTGSGKTFTMQGANMGDSRGIIPRSIEKIMEESVRLAEQGWVYRLEITFLEIYNENVRDLLLENSSEQSNLAILMNPDGGCHVPDLTRIEVTDRSQIDGIMRRAAKHRSVASTNMNSRSSRSHSVFTLHLTGTNQQKNVTLKGTLNLCDLAGSERLDRSGATGDRMKETQAINKSLSCLAGVFSSLASKNAHIPYRDSKLTYLLQQCFSAQGKTLMLVNLSPSSGSYGESLCSLRFARQVNNVELGRPVANQQPQKRQSSPMKRQNSAGLLTTDRPSTPKRNRNSTTQR